MKKQWQEFLNKSEWSYGIVPSLVQYLDKALEAGDDAMVKATLEALATQGVVLDQNGDLRHAFDI